MANFFFRSTFRRGRKVVRIGIVLYLALLGVLLASIVQGVRGIY